METARMAKAEQLANAPGASASRIDWIYLLVVAILFPVLFVVGVFSHLTASRRTVAIDQSGRVESIFHAAAEDAHSAIATAMTDL